MVGCELPQRPQIPIFASRRSRNRRRRMLWWDFDDEEEDDPQQETPVDFDFLSLLSKPKDYYKILEVGYDATEELIRSNYIRLALKWHPDKRKDEGTTTSIFQDINEAYKVLSDPIKRREYDAKGVLLIQDRHVNEYLNRYKSLILTCNGLGTRYPIW